MHPARPYPPSWIDRLIGWIRQRPGPSWIFYAVLWLIAALVNHAAFWLEGSLQFGLFDIGRFAEIPLLLYLLPFVHYLNNVAADALADFRPIVDLTEAQFLDLRYRLTTLPQGLGRISIVFGITLGIMSLIASPESYELSGSSSLPMILYRGLIAVAIMSFIAVTFFHTAHQLRVVTRLQRMPSKISLFQSGPVYAFSSLTARTGIGIAMLVYYLVLVSYELELFGPRPPMSVVDLFVNVVVLSSSIAAFILPLLGMHDRLAAEKTRALFEANRRIELSIARLHAQVDSGAANVGDTVNKNLASLLLEADSLKKLSTWPWRPETLRGFFGAITLPVIVWLITTALERLLTG